MTNRRSDEDFGLLFEQVPSPSSRANRHRKIVQIANGLVTSDIGQVEGQIPINEFRDRDGQIGPRGDDVDVYFGGPARARPVR
jgi:ribosomal protein S1